MTALCAAAAATAALLTGIPHGDTASAASSAPHTRAAEPAPAAPPAPHAKAAPMRTTPRPDAHDVLLAVHGGAGGALKRESADPERARALRQGLTDALRAGHKVLRNGGSSVRAVEAAVRSMEDNELFNAGRGAVFTEDAGHELDASIMRGSDLAAGAVAAVRNVRNPVSAARLVMEKTRHVMLSGEGADDFAARGGLPTVTQDYYWTQHRWDELMKAKGRGPAPTAPKAQDAGDTQGTVGAVATDRRRDLAAATSTGGLVNKMAGRVGDSPVIGAGTYAKNATVAASATGAGEVFIRGAATGTISNLIEFGGADLATAAYRVLVERLPALGGTGGVIALAPDGTFDAPHSSEGLLHGYLTRDGKITTKVFYDESPPNQ